MDMEILDFNLEKTLQELVRIMKIRAEENGLKLVQDFPEEAGLNLRGDPMRLSQILINLISNAVKFTPKGGIQLSVSVRERTDTHITLIFSVSDTGIGIPKDRISGLFMPFSQIDSSTTRKYGGSGLGLSICKRLVKLMGGEIGVKSEEGRGSTFWFTVVFEKSAAENRGGDMQIGDTLPLPNPEDIYGQDSGIKPFRILLVEDNPFNQKVALEFLSLYGYSADLAENGRKAVEMLETKPYDLVFMDIQMPEMDGMEAVKVIRSWNLLEKTPPGVSDTSILQHNCRVPIIAMTAHAMKGDRERYIELGMNDYISKPIHPKLLFHALSRYLKQDLHPALIPVSADEILSSEHPIFRREKMIREIGDLNIYKKIIRIVIKQLSADMEKLPELAQPDEMEGIGKQAHTLKSEAVNLEAPRLLQAAADLELAAKNGDLENVRRLIGKVKEEIPALQKALEDEISVD
jgi:CheY-like chemotaxis protein/HPt (histidine-containing phosphotransfer) domain-containing protein